MSINVLQVIAQRATLTIQYENPFGFASTEYDLPEYTAQTVSKSGRPVLKNLTAVQWRSVCRDIIAADRFNRIKNIPALWKSLARFASPLAQEIFCEEMQKYARKAFQREASTNPVPVETRLDEYMNRLREKLDGYKPVTLDGFAAKMIPLFTLDEFAAAIAA